MMAMNRAESLAYPKTGALAKVNFVIRQISIAVLACVTLVAVVLVLSLDAVQKNTTGAGVTASLRNM